MQPAPIHDALNPLKWLIGTWKSVYADGSYPTIPSFKYCEEITFTSLGQPFLCFNSKSWHPVKTHPMHLESGFLRIKPGSNEVSFMVAHNFGLTSLEEGNVSDNLLQLKSSQISRMNFSKDPAVIEIQRCYRLIDSGKIEYILSMATSNTPLCEHLKVLYEKV